MFLGRNLRRPGFLPAARGSPERRLRRVARGPADFGHGGGARWEDHRTVAFRWSFRWIFAEHWKFTLGGGSKPITINFSGMNIYLQAILM